MACRLRIASANTCQQTCVRRWCHAPRCAGVGGRRRAYLRVHRRSRRSRRSSEPSSEAGTRPRDGQDRTLESARPLGTTRGCPLDPITLWMVLTLPARVCEPISRKTVNARANDSSSHKDHGDIRLSQSRARIEVQLTWLFKRPRRSMTTRQAKQTFGTQDEEDDHTCAGWTSG